MSCLTPQEHDLLSTVVDTLTEIVRTNGIPMKMKFRQQADPANPGSPFPLLRSFPVPAQRIWLVLLDAAVYIRDHKVVHADDVVLINRVIQVLVHVNRNLMMSPDWQSHHIREKQDILAKIMPYVHDDPKLIVRNESMKQRMIDHVLVPMVSIIGCENHDRPV